MTIKYNVPVSKRKELVKTIAAWLGEEIKYCGAPTFAYEVDYFTVDREGKLLFNDMADSEVIERLLEHLYDEGFECVSSCYDEEEPDIKVEEPLEDCPPAYGVPESTDQEEQETELHGYGLTVTMNAESFSAEALNNLHGIIAAKRGLICKALGIERLPVEIIEQYISFPWFKDELDSEQTKAYIHFIAAICEMAKNQKRITATEKETDNDKYAFRCFLLRLGFIGEEYKAERKILLSKLSGSSAFKSGKAKEAVICSE